MSINEKNDIWVNGNFYREHPEKSLGTETTHNSKGQPYRDAYGSEITKYKGSYELLESIDLPEIDLKPETEIPNINENTQVEIVDKENEMIAKSTEEIVTVIKRKKNKKVLIESSGNNDAELLTAMEIYKKYNKHISDGELKSFLWYQHMNGTAWKGVFSEMYSADKTTSENVKEWVDQGYLFYHEGELIPKVFYLSGNAYIKEKRAQDDKEQIVKIYGQKVYDHQLELVTAMRREVYERRLLLDADEDKRLKIPPQHSLCQKIKIDSLEDDKPFYGEALRPNKKNQERGIVGRIDFSKDIGHKFYGSKPFEKLNLEDAFVYWMKTNMRTINFKKGTNWEEIYQYYLNGKQKPADMDKERFGKIKSRSRSEGDRLFSHFLATAIKASDKVRIETEFNEKINSYVTPDFNRIPVAFTAGKYYPGNKVLDIRPEKRSNVAFMISQGCGLIPDEVGFGKTWSGIMVMGQMIEIGQCKRPVMIVPNQTYKQWIGETKGILPHIHINDLYNLSENYLNELYDENNNIKELPENSISFITYEGMQRIGFKGADKLHAFFEEYKIAKEAENEIEADNIQEKIKNTTAFKLFNELFEIMKQGTVYDMNDSVTLRNKIMKMIGIGNRKTVVDIEDLGFDFVGFDEAHAAKKIFTRVVSANKESKYAISNGDPSATAVKSFAISRFISNNNNNRNVMLLTATPITNSPLEVYSMLSLIAYKQMSEGFLFDDSHKRKLNNILDFFDNFAEVTNDFVPTATLKIERRDIFLSWKNLTSLQRLLYQYANYKDPDTIDIMRPEKFELPMPVGSEDRINTILPMTPLQQAIMASVILYAEGKITYDILQKTASSLKPAIKQIIVENDDEDEDEDEDEITEEENKSKKIKGEEVDERLISDNDEDKKGIRLIRSININRSIALSPYLFRLLNDDGKLVYALGKPEYKEYVETSAKLKFTVDMIKMFKEYYESKNEPVSGQIIFCDRGKDFFPLIREYLIKEVGYKEHEIGMIYSGMPTPKGMGKVTGKKSSNVKQWVQNKFLGIDYDEITGLEYNIPDNERMKILIGSSSIREGMNLQKHTIVLYDLFPAWNPTDRKQTIGRIHRQKNKHKYCFIVTPLMMNSIDIFLMQKQHEKTARINAIWNRDGKTNVLDVKDFDQEEIKYELIQDPQVIAQMEIDDLTTRLNDELSGIKSQKEVLMRVKEEYSVLERQEQALKEIVDRYRPPQTFKDGTVQERKVETLLMKLDEIIKEQTDEKEKRFESYGRFNTYWEFNAVQSKYPFLSRDYRTGYLILEKPKWYEDFKTALYYVNRKAKESSMYSDPSGLDANIEKLNFDIENIEREIANVQSEEYLANRTTEVEEIKSKNLVYAQSSDEIISSFKERFADKFSEIQTEEKNAPSLQELIAKMPIMTAEGLYATDAWTMEEIERLNEIIPQTEEMHTDKKGNFTEERKLLHEKIKADIRRNAECITPKQKPIAIITGGLPGSGKTYFLKKFAPYMNDEKVLKIDADLIRSKLPEYRGWNASATHKESSRIVSELLEEVGTPCINDILYDGTMNKMKNYKPLINQLKRLGYETYIIFMDIPLKMAKQRVIKRYAETGRFVPMQVLEMSSEVNTKIYDELKSIVDGYIKVDGQTGTILEKGGNELPNDRFWFNPKSYEKDQKLIELARKVKAIMFELHWIQILEKGGIIGNGRAREIDNVEMVDIDIIEKYMEFDRLGKDALGEHSEKWIDELIESFTHEGIKEPLMIEYFQYDRKALLTEGNHRIVAAKKLGYIELPVRVIRSKRNAPEKAKLVPGINPDEFGYVPADLSPSQIGIQARKIKSSDYL